MAQLCWVICVFMDRLGLIIQIAGIVLLASMLFQLWRKDLFGTFPLFASYSLCMLASTVTYLITLPTRHAYFYAYWITTPLQVLLAILAVHESFRKVFRVFYLLRWFRICFPAGIVIALSYASIRSYFHPPVHAPGIYAAIISGMLAAQYVILTIAIIFFALVKLLQVPWRIHEFRIVLGFGFSAAVMALAASLRSDFGTNFAFLTQMAPALTYILSLAIWLSAVVHPLPERTGPDKESGPELGPQEVVSKLTSELTTVRSLLKRG